MREIGSQMSQIPKSLVPVSSRLSVAGLFAGIGGFEVGLEAAGHQTVLLCEIDEGARRVLSTGYPEVPLRPDVRTLRSLPEVDLVAAGFPCTDLSQAGLTAGIKGQQSGLVSHVFRLLSKKGRGPSWLLLENVPFMLQLDRGRAMHYLTDQLDEAGLFWAYRIIDARAFGLPQRRRRVLLLASRTEDPRAILFQGNVESQADPDDHHNFACGFYWTEGLRGLGWAVDAVPTLKGGSTIGIPSPPAIWMPTGAIVTPEIRDAERLQGFPAGWTSPAVMADESEAKASNPGRRLQAQRWKLVGNAVSVPMAEWLGQALAHPVPYDETEDELLQSESPWPRAAWGWDGKSYKARVTEWPVHASYAHLEEFLEYPTHPLSQRAAIGFLNRARAARLRFRDGFLEDVAAHVESLGRVGGSGRPCGGART